MINALYIGLAGMSTAMRKLAVAAGNIADVDSSAALQGSSAGNSSSSASNIASAGVPQPSAPGGVPTVQVVPVRRSFVPRPDSSAAATGDTATATAADADPVKELIDMLEAQQSFAANAKSEKTVAEIFQSLYGTPT